jgi:hypothetical protein
MPESYGLDSGRWLADHEGWRVEPGFEQVGYYAWRPDDEQDPLSGLTLDELAGQLRAGDGTA